MALYVLVAFRNEQEARSFINLHSDTVEAVYKKPTLFCDPLDSAHPSNRRVIGFTKGKKWGWWVCAACGKPRKHAMKPGDSSFGNNLLDKIKEEIEASK